MNYFSEKQRIFDGTFYSNPFIIESPSDGIFSNYEIYANGLFLRPGIDFMVSDCGRRITFSDQVVKPYDRVVVRYVTMDILDAMAAISPLDDFVRKVHEG